MVSGWASECLGVWVVGCVSGWVRGWLGATVGKIFQNGKANNFEN